MGLPLQADTDQEQESVLEFLLCLTKHVITQSASASTIIDVVEDDDDNDNLVEEQNEALDFNDEESDARNIAEDYDMVDLIDIDDIDEFVGDQLV